MIMSRSDETLAFKRLWIRSELRRVVNAHRQGLPEKIEKAYNRMVKEELQLMLEEVNRLDGIQNELRTSNDID